MRKKVSPFIWVGVPILLAVGCSTGSRDSSVSYSPTLKQSVTPTSDRAATRLYSTPDVSVGATARPPGATSQDWQLAEEIRALLSSDEKLGNAPMAAVVNNGVVTLRGGVRNEKDRRNLIERISALPGVQRVDDEMEFKNPLGIGPGETKSY